MFRANRFALPHLAISRKLKFALGDTCGAVYLDYAFVAQIKMLAGNLVDAMQPRKKKNLMNKWEYSAKREFKHQMNVEEDFDYEVPGYNEGENPNEVLLKKYVNKCKSCSSNGVDGVETTCARYLIQFVLKSFSLYPTRSRLSKW